MRRPKTGRLHSFDRWPYDHLVTGEVSAIREWGATALASYSYDDLGRRSQMARANGTGTAYSYDSVSRLNAFTHDFAGTANDLTVDFTFNPAGQILTRTSSNTAYSFPVANNDLTETPNGARRA